MRKFAAMIVADNEAAYRQDMTAHHKAAADKLMAHLVEAGFVRFDTSPEVTLGDRQSPPEERTLGVCATIQVEKWDKD